MFVLNITHYNKMPFCLLIQQKQRMILSRIFVGVMVIRVFSVELEVQEALSRKSHFDTHAISNDIVGHYDLKSKGTIF